MDMDTVHQEVAFGNPEGIGPTDHFGTFAQGGIVAVLPTTTPSWPISAPTGDSGSRINTFLGRVFDMKQIMLNSSTSPAGVKGNGKMASHNAACHTSPALTLRSTALTMAREEDLRVSPQRYWGGDDISLGHVSNNTRVCSVHPSLCTFSSHERKYSLHPGWYIKAARTQEGGFLLSVSICAGGGRSGFRGLYENS